MVNFFLVLMVKIVLWLRYRTRINGLDKILQKGRKGILFLPNHPALIDPIILVSQLYIPFKVRALADEDQIDRFLIRWLARRFNVLPIPDLTKKRAQSAEQVRDVIERCAGALKQNDNVLLYPAGHIYRRHQEQIGGNSAVERILKALPDVRIVLIRTHGLWGSRFSWSYGKKPLVTPTLLKGLKSILLNGIFFSPRRTVAIELFEPEMLPRDASRKEINGYLEEYYNQKPESNTYVPYTIWEGGGVQTRPEPQRHSLQGNDQKISPVIRKQVTRFLSKISGINGFNDETSLARDMGMDSLVIVELFTWLEEEFGFPQGNIDSVQTVGDVMLAACGEAVSLGENDLEEVPNKWQDKPRYQRPENFQEMKLTDAFLAQAEANIDKAIIADQRSGIKTYRDLLIAIMVLKREIEKLPGKYIGIMLPASVGATILYLSTLFGGKIPVMVNWTLGRKNLLHNLESLGVEKVMTAQLLLSRVEKQGIDLTDITDRLLCLEDLGKEISKWSKLRAFIKSRVSWTELKNARVQDTAVILFTSGSESLPKIVPLTHRNILTNISDVYDIVTINDEDSFLGILPPFHSFGIAVCIAMPLCMGLRVVYYPNPTDGGMLGRIIDAYNVSFMIGTPTFLNGIVRASTNEQLQSLRLVVTGAEKCPPRVYEAVRNRCPQTTILEGYGVTECSPVISANREDNPVAESIGKILPSLEYSLVDPDNNHRVELGEKGMLLVRGPSVFDGYQNYDGPSPFVEFEGKQWYKTGDLITEDADGLLTFSGRLKRFIKLGGEMVSLVAIESVLEQVYTDEKDEGPCLAVVPTQVEDRPELILYTTKPIQREEVNQHIRQSGLSGLHNIRQVVQLNELPLLGTGKVDYRGLAALTKHDTI